jgi:hypothetical protein
LCRNCFQSKRGGPPGALGHVAGDSHRKP